MIRRLRLSKIENCYTANVYIYRTGTYHESESYDTVFYAFGGSATDASKFVNCYSSNDDIYAQFIKNGSLLIPNETVDARKRGTVNQSKETIIDTFVTAESAFEADTESINEGYPVLITQEIDPVGYAYTSLSFDMIKGENESADDIRKMPNLISTLESCNVSWSSSNPAIDIAKGTINRKPSDTAVTLTAIISKSGYPSRTKTFNLTVKAYADITYETLTSNKGYTYNFLSFDGEPTKRGYLGVYSWLSDDSGFIFGRDSGEFYLYDITNNTYEYLDSVAMSESSHLGVYIAASDRAYYVKREDGRQVLYSIDPRNPSDKVCEYKAESGVNVGIEVTNDGRYTYYHKGRVQNDDYTRTVECGRIDLVNDTIDRTFTYTFSHPEPDSDGNVSTRTLNHHNINPEYPNLMMFVIDDGDPDVLNALTERLNIVNLDEVNGKSLNIDSSEVKHYDDDSDKMRPSHFIWSRDGKYIYMSELGRTEAFLDLISKQRFTKIAFNNQTVEYDYGSRERWEWTGDNPGANHGNADAAGKWALVDNKGISLLNMETGDSTTIITGMDLKTGHPYHAHAEMSASGKIGTWGMVHPETDVLGIAWIDVDSFRIKSITSDGNSVTGVTVMRSEHYTLDAPAELKLYVAAYDKDGRFVDVRITDCENTSGDQVKTFTELQIPTGGSVKAMLWDGSKQLATELETF